MTDPGKRLRAEALESLRQSHLDDLERIYQVQLSVVTDPDSKKADVNNGVKNLLTMLGVGRVGPEKPPEAPKGKAQVEQVAPISKERLAEIDRKLSGREGK
jgi:hypothetical protein